MLHKQIALVYPWQASIPILLPWCLRALWCCCGGLCCRVACCSFVCSGCGYRSFDCEFCGSLGCGFCGCYGCGFCGNYGCGFCGSFGCGCGFCSGFVCGCTVACCWWWECGSIERALGGVVKFLAKLKQDHFFKKIAKQFSLKKYSS